MGVKIFELSREEALRQLAAQTPGVRRPLKTGYAEPPGTGPSGETCKTCCHCVRLQPGAKSYHKCLLMKPFWTGSNKTDVLLKSPACVKWEPEKKKES